MNALMYAIQGFITAFRSELNLKIQILVAFGVVICGYFFNVTKFEWLILFFCIGLVISLELINTAIEYLVNLVSPEKNPLAGKIKDIGAAAVLVAALTAFICGAIVFLPYLIRVFSSYK